MHCSRLFDIFTTGKMNWDAAEKRHDPEAPEGTVFQGLQRLEKLRAAHRAFDGGADVWIVDTRDDGVLGIGRYFRGEKLIALFNFSEWEKTVFVSELGDFTDLLSGEAADKYRIILPSGGFRWLICDFEEEKK